MSDILEKKNEELQAKYKELEGGFFKYYSTSRNLHDTAHSNFCNCCKILLCKDYRDIQTPFRLRDEGSEDSTDRSYSCSVCGYSKSRSYTYGEKYGHYTDSTFATLCKYHGDGDITPLFVDMEKREDKSFSYIVEDENGNLFWQGDEADKNYYFRVSLNHWKSTAQIRMYDDEDKAFYFLIDLEVFDQFAKKHEFFIPKPGVFDSLMDVAEKIKITDELTKSLKKAKE